MRRAPAFRAAIAVAAALFLIPACVLEPVDSEPPSLVVLVAVDQLMPDHLERYGEVFQGGLRTLMDEGLVFSDAVHDHGITYTSPGHASLATGVVPSRHGIISNSWREWRDGEWVSVSSVADPNTRTVGGGGGGSSPRNVLTDGLPDWILEADPESRVVSVSGKSTASVLMAARARGHVYWFSTGAPGFVTSTFYRTELPEWVVQVNEEVVPHLVPTGCWEADLSPEAAALSRPDTVPYEADGVQVHFPHCVDDAVYRNHAHFVSRTPFLDDATFALARAAVEALGLGGAQAGEPGGEQAGESGGEQAGESASDASGRRAPDYLAVALSATDRVGHEFGPWSREQLQNLVHLDRELGAFLDFLDETVGRDRYVLALSSDHGVLPLPEYLVEQGEYGVRLGGELSAAIRAAAEEAGVGPPPGPRVDEGVGEASGAEAAELRERAARAMEEVEWVEAAMPLELLAGDMPADSFVDLYRRSFHPDRITTNVSRYGVEVRPREGVMVRSTGTTHGVPYLHDRRVPLIFFGAGIEAGVSATPARTVDVAPTLARIGGVPAPDGLDGRDLAPTRR